MCDGSVGNHNFNNSGSNSNNGDGGIGGTAEGAGSVADGGISKNYKPSGEGVLC